MNPNMKLVSRKEVRRTLAVALYPTMEGWESVTPETAAKPGQIATYTARSQLPIKIEKIILPDGAEIVDMTMGNWRKSRDGDQFPVVQISVPIYIQVRVGLKNEPPLVCGVIDDGRHDWKADTLLPFHEVKEVPKAEATIAAGTSLVLTRLIDFDFVPRRFVLAEGDPEDLVVTDIKIGRNSSIAASGGFPLGYLTPDRAPRLALNADKAVPAAINLSVCLSNLGTEARTISMVVIGEGLPVANALGVTEIADDKQEN